MSNGEGVGVGCWGLAHHPSLKLRVTGRANATCFVMGDDYSVAGFTYGENGNLLTATNKDALLSFVYDTINRIESPQISVNSCSLVVQYTYNKNYSAGSVLRVSILMFRQLDMEQHHQMIVARFVYSFLV